jgi:hypothetical protein
MDVAFGETNVSLPRKFVKDFGQCLLVGLIWILLFLSEARADVGEKPIHFSGDKQLWDRKLNLVELFGHASVTQPGESLTADYIRLDLNSRLLDARGNCIYFAMDSVIRGEEMHFNLDTRTGTIVGGRVSNDQFTLRGERINKMGEGRFQTHWGDYTTCRDCAPTWSLLGEDVDMQVDGYAFISNMMTRIKDAPTFWLPYLIVPMKTRRQSGFLFPSLAFSEFHGTAFVFPYFWAISRSADMTFGLGQYTARGWRYETEGRYALSARSWGKANLYYTRDKTVPTGRNRWAFEITQSQELPYGIDEKLKLTEVGDNRYPFHFSTDVRGNGEAFLPSTLIFSRGTEDFSAFASLQRYRNLLNSSPDQESQIKAFDSRTVQALPTVVVTTNDKFLFGSKIFGGMTVGLTNFTRAAGPFDYDTSSVPFGKAAPDGLAPRYGVDPLREAVRISYTPSVYTTLRPFEVVSMVPSLQYRGFFYHFGNGVPNLNRGYLLFQTDLTAQLEKIYEFPDDTNTPRAKHLIRPILTYSYIPDFAVVENSSHPFLEQIRYAQERSIFGYNFDNSDIVPINFTQSNANYFVPLGNSLAYGFTTQWIRRKGSLQVEYPTYQTAVELSAGQAINFLELGKVNPEGTPPRVFTRFFSRMNLNFDKLGSTTTYYYYPDLPVRSDTSRHTITSNLTYVFERGLHQRILTFDRSVALGYTFNRINGQTSNLTGSFNFSLNDYFMPYGAISYTFLPDPILYGGSAGLQIQSPSQCWKFTATFNYDVVAKQSFAVDLSLNLTGTGFGGITQMANQAMSQK